MPRHLIVVLLLLAAIPFAGCTSTGSRAASGALLGSAIGAGAGAIVGHQTGDAGPGAAIGAGLGALTGGLIGGALDQVDEEARSRADDTDVRVETALHEVRTREARLSILDVIRMSQAGISDDLIIAKMDQSGSYYDLSAAEIIDLRRSSVSERVISHMLRSPPREVVRERRYRVRTRRVVVPADAGPIGCPPLTVPVSFGFSYRHCN